MDGQAAVSCSTICCRRRRGWSGSASTSSRPRSHAAQHQQVLHEVVETLGLGADVLEHRGSLDRVVEAARSSQDLGQAQDRRDRRPQLVADDVNEGLTKLAGAPFLGDQFIALILQTAPFGDVLARPDHAQRPAVGVPEDTPRAVRPVDGPVGPEQPEVQAEAVRLVQRGGDRLLERLAVVRVDHREIGREVGGMVGRLQAVLPEDGLGPGELARSRRPTPRTRCPTPRA